MGGRTCLGTSLRCARPASCHIQSGEASPLNTEVCIPQSVRGDEGGVGEDLRMGLSHRWVQLASQSSCGRGGRGRAGANSQEAASEEAAAARSQGDENMTNDSRDAADGYSLHSPLEEFSDFHGGHYLNPKE